MSIPGRRPSDPYFATGDVALGIDVSTYQGSIDWTRVARAVVPNLRDNRVRFAFVRLGDGISVDAAFDRNFRGARDAGLKVGAYRYFRARYGGRRVAEIDAALIEKAGGFGLGDLSVALDLETNAANDERGNPGSMFPERVLAEARSYLERIESLTGRLPLVYSGAYLQSLSLAISRPPDEIAQWDLWSPSYTSDARYATGWGHPTFWQFRSDGRVDGVPNAVDLNYYRGSALSLKVWALNRSIPLGRSPSPVRGRCSSERQ